MKLIICGLPGTGKTSISKNISNNYNYQYINDWNFFNNSNTKILNLQNKSKVSKQHSKFLYEKICLLKNNIVADFEFSISPKDFMKLNKQDDNIRIVYLGFNSIKPKELFNKFRSNKENNKYTNIELFKQIKFFIKESKKFKRQCDKFNLKFFDINKDKDTIQNEIFEYLNISKQKEC